MAVGQKKGWQKVTHRRPVYLPQRGLQEEVLLSVRWGSGAVCSRGRGRKGRGEERGEGGGGPESVSESDIICQIEKNKHKAQSVRFAQ